MYQLMHHRSNIALCNYTYYIWFAYRKTGTTNMLKQKQKNKNKSKINILKLSYNSQQLIQWIYLHIAERPNAEHWIPLNTFICTCFLCRSHKFATNYYYIHVVSFGCFFLLSTSYTLISIHWSFNLFKEFLAVPSRFGCGFEWFYVRMEFVAVCIKYTHKYTSRRAHVKKKKNYSRSLNTFIGLPSTVNYSLIFLHGFAINTFLSVCKCFWKWMKSSRCSSIFFSIRFSYLWFSVVFLLLFFGRPASKKCTREALGSKRAK